jgi:DNA-directed RNA polymerase specialized sigma24 family protein
MFQKDYVNKDTDLQSLHLHLLRSRCMEESERFFQRLENDPRFCYELFRRAISLRNQQAWEYIYLQYQPLVSGWVERHPLFHVLNEEKAYFVNRVFEKMWRRLTPEKFALSTGLSAVLSYLHKCVNSVLVDTMRTRERYELFGEETEEQSGGQGIEEQSPEEEVERRDLAEKIWAMLQERLKDEKERLTAYGNFVLALKAADIYQEYPGKFRSVQEVYRVKENLLARLKRDQEFMDFLGE